MISKFFLGLAGVDQTLLARTRERTKYERLGGAVLATAVFAAVSATFAVWSAMGAPLPIALAVGTVWGLAILNLDSWIVASSKRQPKKRHSLALALPRLVMAVLLGLVISEPLVLQLFRGEIEAEIKVMQSEEQAAFEEELRTHPRYVAAERTRAEVLVLQEELATGVPRDAVIADPSVRAAKAELDRVREDLAAAEAQVACEGQGTCGSGSAGVGAVFRANVAARDRLAQEERVAAAAYATAQTEARRAAESSAQTRARDLRARLQDMEEEVLAAEQQRFAQIAEHDAKLETSDGLLARIDALHRLTADDPVLRLVRCLVVLVLLAVECTPVLLKLLQTFAQPGEYEALVDLQERATLEAAALELWQVHVAKQKALELAAVEPQAAIERAELAQHAALGRQALEQEAELNRARAEAEAELETARLLAAIERQAANEPHLRERLRLWAKQEEARIETETALDIVRAKRKAEGEASLKATRISLQAQVGFHHEQAKAWKEQQKATLDRQLREFRLREEAAQEESEPAATSTSTTAHHEAGAVVRLLTPRTPPDADVTHDTAAL